MIKRYQEVLLSSKVRAALFECDKQEAKRHKAKGCPYCEGKLDRADYERKARGLKLEGWQRRRISFCCRKCKKRSSPESIIFLRHKVFAFVAVFLVLSVCVGGHSKRLSSACALCGVSEVTLRRWRYWSQRFLESRQWKLLRRKLSGALSVARWPCSLLEEFSTGSQALSVSVMQALTYVSILSIQTF